MSETQTWDWTVSLGGGLQFNRYYSKSEMDELLKELKSRRLCYKKCKFVKC